MNTGVEILLKRMETNPDDFVYSLHSGGMSRWMRLVDHAIGDELLTLEEHEAIKAGMKEVKRLRFTEMVMKELAGVDETSEDPKLQLYQQRMASVMSSVGATQATWGNGLTTNALYQSAQAQQATLTLGDTTLSEAGLKQMLATHKAMREQTKSKHWWDKTLPELLGKK